MYDGSVFVILGKDIYVDEWNAHNATPSAFPAGKIIIMIVQFDCLFVRIASTGTNLRCMHTAVVVRARIYRFSQAISSGGIFILI